MTMGRPVITEKPFDEEWIGSALENEELVGSTLDLTISHIRGELDEEALFKALLEEVDVKREKNGGSEEA